MKILQDREGLEQNLVELLTLFGLETSVDPAGLGEHETPIVEPELNPIDAIWPPYVV